MSDRFYTQTLYDYPVDIDVEVRFQDVLRDADDFDLFDYFKWLKRNNLLRFEKVVEEINRIKEES